MKAKEIFLGITAFTLLLLTFCIVFITTKYPDKFVDTSIRHLRDNSGKVDTNRPLICSSAVDSETYAHKPEVKRTFPATSNHSNHLSMDVLSAQNRSIRSRPDNMEQLSKVELNGRVYLENTTDIEVCESEKEEKENRESIE